MCSANYSEAQKGNSHSSAAASHRATATTVTPTAERITILFIRLTPANDPALSHRATGSGMKAARKPASRAARGQPTSACLFLPIKFNTAITTAATKARMSGDTGSNTRIVLMIARRVNLTEKMEQPSRLCGVTRTASSSPIPSQFSFDYPMEPTWLRHPTSVMRWCGLFLPPSKFISFRAHWYR